MYLPSLLVLLCTCLTCLAQLDPIPARSWLEDFNGTDYCGAASRIILNSKNSRLLNVVWDVVQQFEAQHLLSSVEANTAKWRARITYEDFGGHNVNRIALAAAWQVVRSYVALQRPGGISEYVISYVSDTRSSKSLGAEISLWIYDKTNEITMKRELGSGRLRVRDAPSTYQGGCNDQSSVENLPYYLTPTPGQCNGPQPFCSMSQCAPSIGVGGTGSNDGKCLSFDLLGCPCFATIETKGHCGSTPGPCDQDGCNVSNGHCAGRYNGCPCRDKPVSCPARKPNYEVAGCNGVGTGGFGSNDGKCQGGDLDGCLCSATRWTPDHCGQPGPCNQNGCKGMFIGVGTAVCMGAFWGCPCHWT